MPCQMLIQFLLIFELSLSCYRFAVDSKLWEDKLSEAMSFDDVEEEINGTIPMDMSAILEERFGWTAIKFSTDALSRQFG